MAIPIQVCCLYALGFSPKPWESKSSINQFVQQLLTEQTLPSVGLFLGADNTGLCLLLLVCWGGGKPGGTVTAMNINFQ